MLFRSVLHHTTGHNLLDLHKIRTELGYRDVLPSVEAMAQTAHWLVEHPVETGSQADAMLGDPFDYDAEDRLAERYAGALGGLAEFAYEEASPPHPYAHPRERHKDDHYGR